MFLRFLKIFSDHLSFIALVYSFLFFLIINIGYFSYIAIEINVRGIIYYIYLLLVLLLFNLTKGFFTFTFYFVFFIFLNIFFTVNF
jgi:hypothetical protein